ncbi:hypothetical protein PSP31121_02872 [Pandoraea sputorum]|uniref:Uncharacterized protein n=1 Tax=Pandoraea sputorum TaxID=93222 RepID=A0A5E5B7X2_9BURK|nr:hypothetical protein PSP31121_02872 [Pandoraea sputorum]
MEDGSSRMWPVGTVPLTYGFPTGDPMPEPHTRIFAFTDRALRGAAGYVRAFFRRDDLR